MAISNAVSTLFSLAVGSFVSFLVAKRYYLRAAADLRKEAGELRRLNGVILQSLENAGLVRYSRNQSGNITGFVIEVVPAIVRTAGHADIPPTEPEPSDPKKTTWDGLAEKHCSFCFT